MRRQDSADLALPLPSQEDTQAELPTAGVPVEAGHLGEEEGEAWVWPVPDPPNPQLSFGAPRSFLGIALAEVGAWVPVISDEGRGPLLTPRTAAALPAGLLPAPPPLGAAGSSRPPSPACAFHFCPLETPGGVGTKKSAFHPPLISSH